MKFIDSRQEESLLPLIKKESLPLRSNKIPNDPHHPEL